MPETVETHGRTLTVYDLSQRLSNSTSDFQPNSHHIEYVDADSTAAMTGKLFGMGPDYWPDGKGYRVETVSLSTHWDNEPASRILANCHRAAVPGSALLSLEGIVRDVPPLDPMVLLIDLAMLLLVGGRERTRSEFDELFRSAGYHIEQVIPLPQLPYFPYHIIEAKRH